MRREAFKHAELASLILNKNKRCGDFLRTFYPFLKNQVTMMYITITTKVKTIATMLVALDSMTFYADITGKTTMNGGRNR